MLCEAIKSGQNSRNPNDQQKKKKTRKNKIEKKKYEIMKPSPSGKKTNPKKCDVSFDGQRVCRG